MIKGKGRAGKPARKHVKTQQKDDERAKKRVRIDNTEVEESESEGEKEENVGEKGEKADVSLLSN